jgi:hypothetical protein
MSPLASQNPLAQLNDIIAPTAASPWPPAPIYWLLLLALLLLTTATLYLFKRVKKQRLKQQQALTKLQQLEKEDASFILLNRLLKGVALSYFPRQQVASLHGGPWFDFLQRYATAELFSGKQHFLEYLYRYSEQPCSPDDFAQAKKWIKQLPKQIKKQHRGRAKHV